ncbi:hypothetical protein SAMN05414139_08116 [Burkholderia sp. D7]|nr:hypothetical protein SAMN05414139_08116 [Burkholderia sp. D7]
MNDLEDVYSYDIRRTGSPVCEGLLFDAKRASGCHPKHLGDRPNLVGEGNAFKLAWGTQHAGDINGAGHANTARRAYYPQRS